ncbi:MULTISPECIES: DUF6497 family protein [unclassified Marinovum]
MITLAFIAVFGAPAPATNTALADPMLIDPALADPTLSDQTPVDPAPVDMPSGLGAFLLEYLDETADMHGIFRARFVAPDLESKIDDLEAVFTDMEYLCNAAAVPEVTLRGIAVQRIIVSISTEPLAFGSIAPDIAQYFESYSLQDGICIWELF